MRTPLIPRLPDCPNRARANPRFGYALSALLVASATLLASHHASAQTTTYQFNGTVDGIFSNPANWTAAGVAPTNSTTDTRLNVNGANALVYTADQGVTTYTGTPGNRGLVIGSGAPAGGPKGAMIITGGTLITSKATASDIIGNSLDDTVTASLTIAGGQFVSSGLGVDMGLSNAVQSTFTIDSGSATISKLSVSSGFSKNGPVRVGKATLNLNGGVLQVSSFGYGNENANVGGGIFYDALHNGANSINFNGGLLRAGADNAAYLPSGWGGHILVKSPGANIDTNGFAITIDQPVETDAVSLGGGLTKSGAGTLTLGGVNTYTGLTKVNAGTLVLSSTGSLAASSGVEIAPGATFNTTALSLALPGTQTVTFDLDGSGSGSAGLLQAGDLDITNGKASFSVTGTTLNDAAYILASYTSLTGAAFASVTNLPAGYTVDYNYLGGNQIALVPGGAPASPYATWASSKLLTAGVNDGPTQDPDQDGVSNLLEFALGGDPLAVASAPLPVVAASGANVTFTYDLQVAAQAEYTIVAESSANLAGWDPVVHGANGASIVTTPLNSTTDHVVVTLPNPGPRLFVRLHVTAKP